MEKELHREFTEIARKIGETVEKFLKKYPEVKLHFCGVLVRDLDGTKALYTEISTVPEEMMHFFLVQECKYLEAKMAGKPVADMTLN